MLRIIRSVEANWTTQILSRSERINGNQGESITLLSIMLSPFPYLLTRNVGHKRLLSAVTLKRAVTKSGDNDESLKGISDAWANETKWHHQAQYTHAHSHRHEGGNSKQSTFEQRFWLRRERKGSLQSLRKGRMSIGSWPSPPFTKMRSGVQQEQGKGTESDSILIPMRRKSETYFFYLCKW